MARVVAFIPDLLFGSRVIAALQAAGHEAVLAGDPHALSAALTDADVVVVDLTFDAGERLAQLARARLPGMPALAFYSHVEVEVREQALRAGVDLVVPRSRMAREGAALVDRLLSAPRGPSLE